MKTNVTTKVHVDQQLLREIHTQVMETLAVDVALQGNNKKIFCAADLWNIHRQRKTRVQRRFM